MNNITQSRLNKARINKFILLFNLPEALKKVDRIYGIARHTINQGAVQFSIKSVEAPETTVKAISQRYASGNLYVSSHSKDAYDQLSIKFDVDNMFANWGTINEWLNFLHDEEEAIPDADNVIPADNKHGVFRYDTNLMLIALDEYNKALAQFVYTMAFPTKLTNISWDYTRSDKIEATATFAFSQIHTKYLTDQNIIISPDA